MAGVVYEEAEVKGGVLFKCPHCGEEVTLVATKPVPDYKGKTLHFPDDDPDHPGEPGRVILGALDCPTHGVIDEAYMLEPLTDS